MKKKITLKDLIVTEDSKLYQVLGTRMIRSSLILFVVLYGLSFLFASPSITCDGEVTQYICASKMEQYKKSNLQLHDHTRAYLLISNVTLLVTPLFLFPFLLKEKYKKNTFSFRDRLSILKGCIVFIIMLMLWSFGSYLMPFTPSASKLIFAREFIYVLFNSLFIVLGLLAQFGMIIFIKALFTSNKEITK
ncbi:MAG: hypothetical protein ISR69_11220 [Gammaproteobacteria bacterium]|nr:hypothetical protein [Gammaproteobacteria bacterium]